MAPERVKQASLGKYQLIAEIGRGGSATVYLAVLRGMTGFTKLFVVKLLNSDIRFDEEDLQMFINEARLASRLNHPNVVQSLEFQEDGGRYFLAMEYLEGQSLSRILQGYHDEDRFPIDTHIRVLCDVLHGLHYAHELRDYDETLLRIVHRDVSPHNVFVTYDGIVKLLDFGIAKAAGSKTDTASGALKGKVAYMAPDQFTGEELDCRVDLFAVGVMLWEAVANQRMWKGLADLDIIRSLMTPTIPAIESVCPSAPEPLIKICRRALAPDKGDRYATAADFCSDLEEYLASIDARISSATIAEYLTKRFGKERERIRAIVHSELQALENTPLVEGIRYGSLPDLALPDLSFTGSLSNPTGSGRSGRSTLSGSSRSGSSRRTNIDVIAGEKRSLSRWLPWAAATVVMAGGIGALAVWKKPAHPSASSEQASVSGSKSTSPVAGASDPRSALIEVRVTATPEGARLFLDDAALPGNPFSGSFPRDGAMHRLRAEADGYLPRAELVTFDDNVTRTISLATQLTSSGTSRNAQGAKTPGRDPAVKPQSSAAASSTPAPRAIDDRNPFQ